MKDSENHTSVSPLPTVPARADAAATLPSPGASAAEASDSPAHGHDRADELVRQLHEGVLTVTALTVDERRLVVAHLTEQAFTNAEIADVMGVSIRTIRRDRAALRAEHRVSPGPELGDELLGEYERIIMAGIARLTRFARDSTNPAHTRVWAEREIIEAYHRYIEMARRMKYIEEGTGRIHKARQQRDCVPGTLGFELRRVLRGR